MTDIFISYKREDRPRAKAVAAMFATYGFDVWWDVNLLAGQEFADTITSIIRNAKAVVVLWTPESIQSDWVKAEAALARSRGILVPAWLEKVDLPVPYNTLHTHDLTGWSGSASDEILLPLLAAVSEIANPSSQIRLEQPRHEIERALNQPSHEANFWRTVASKVPQSVAEYESYLKAYGENGTFSELARLRIEEMKEKAGANADSAQRAKLSLFGIELSIARSVGMGLILAGTIGFVWWNWEHICDRTGWCVKPAMYVEVQSVKGPVADVSVAVSSLNPRELLDTGTTDGDGFTILEIRKREHLHVKAIADREPNVPEYSAIVQVTELPFYLKLERSRFAESANAAPDPLSAEPVGPEVYRDQIASGEISKDALLFALGAFEFDSSSDSSVAEAKMMLQYLGAQRTFSKDQHSVSGIFGCTELGCDDELEVTIWKDSYGLSNQYGIRFGETDGAYSGSNKTLVHITK